MYFCSDFTTSIKDFKINSTKPSWYNYFLCGVKGILEFSKLSDPVGLDVTVDGTVPPSAGLSSSSAMVCCAALSLMHANKLAISKVSTTVKFSMFCFGMCSCIKCFEVDYGDLCCRCNCKQSLPFTTSACRILFSVCLRKGMVVDRTCNLICPSLFAWE